MSVRFSMYQRFQVLGSCPDGRHVQEFEPFGGKMGIEEDECLDTSAFVEHLDFE